MRKAVIDIGSNTINLIVADIYNGKLEVLYDGKNHARLARGGIVNGAMTLEAMQRGYDAINGYVLVCKKFLVEPHAIHAFATATIRDTANGAEFVNRIKADCGVTIETVTGDTEAYMIYLGVKAGFPLSDKTVLILDIGGGSNELIICNNKQIFWKQSFPLGVSRLLDLFHPSDPISSNDILRLNHHFAEVLRSAVEAIHTFKPEALIGSSGSFDTFRALVHAKKEIEYGTATWVELYIDDFNQLFPDLKQMNISQRRSLKGMDPMRVEYMPVAVTFVEYVLKITGIKTVFQCGYAIKEGAFFV